MREFEPQLVLVSLSEASGEIVSKLHLDYPALPIIVVGAVNDPDEMLALLRKGAADFIIPPLKPGDIIPRVRRLLDGEAEAPARNLKTALGMRNLVGRSPAFLAETNKIPMVAQCDATVLISGETGTGKELCARAIHYLSPRSKRPFIPINCGAIPTDLAENQLFGHERGKIPAVGSLDHDIALRSVAHTLDSGTTKVLLQNEGQSNEGKRSGRCCSNKVASHLTLRARARPF